MGAEARLEELGIVLPEPSPAFGSYVGWKRQGDLVYVSGHGPFKGDETVTGKVDAAVSVEQAYDAARYTGLLILAALRAELRSLDRVRSIVKIFGMVNCSPGFNNTPAVINGCSDLLVEVFGEEIGSHARSAVGMAELPFDIPVEIELIAAADPTRAL